MSASSTSHAPAAVAAFLPRVVTSAHNVPANYTRLYRTGCVISAGGSITIAATGELLVI